MTLDDCWKGNLNEAKDNKDGDALHVDNYFDINLET